jgi:hypothetical protein
MEGAKNLTLFQHHPPPPRELWTLQERHGESFKWPSCRWMLFSLSSPTWSFCREMDALSRRHFYSNATPNRAHLHLPASDKPSSFSKRSKDFLHKSLLRTDMC